MYVNSFSSLLAQILGYFTGMCTGHWYIINGWRRHGSYWRKRSECLRWTESSSCFGEVIISTMPMWLDANHRNSLNFISDSYKSMACNFVLWTGLFIMAPIFFCLMMSSVLSMLKLLNGFCIRPFWVLLWSNILVYFVPIMFRLFPWVLLISEGRTWVSLIKSLFLAGQVHSGSLSVYGLSVLIKSNFNKWYVCKDLKT